MKLHNETVSPRLIRCLKTIMQSDIFKDFNLVGGTCLSLQLGHRRSIDIDLFTAIDYGSMNTTAMKVFLQENFPYSENLDSLDQPALGYSVRIGESPADCIKADFFYTENFIFPVKQTDGIRLADIREIAGNENQGNHSGGTQTKRLLGHLRTQQHVQPERNDRMGDDA